MIHAMRKLSMVIFGVGMLAAVAHSAQNIISQKGKVYSPDEITLAVGGTVRIDNDDNIPHNAHVTRPGGEASNLGLQSPGQHVDIILEKPGDYTVRCGIHPKMKLVIRAN